MSFIPLREHLDTEPGVGLAVATEEAYQATADRLHAMWPLVTRLRAVSRPPPDARRR